MRGRSTISEAPRPDEESAADPGPPDAAAPDPTDALNWQNPIYDNDFWNDTEKLVPDEGGNIPSLDRFFLSLLFPRARLDTREGTLLAALYPADRTGSKTPEPPKPEAAPSPPEPPDDAEPVVNETAPAAQVWRMPLPRADPPSQPPLVEVTGHKRDPRAEIFYQAEPDIITTPPPFWTRKRIALVLTLAGAVALLIVLLSPA